MSKHRVLEFEWNSDKAAEKLRKHRAFFNFIQDVQTMIHVPQKGRPRWGKWLIYLTIFGAVGTLIWSQLPRGAYSTDLTRLGKGQPALVLAYDTMSMGGMTAMGLLDALRGEYADRIEFLVADLGVPDSRNFAQRLGAVNGTVMLFSGDGSHLRTIHPPRKLGSEHSYY